MLPAEVHVAIRSSCCQQKRTAISCDDLLSACYCEWCCTYKGERGEIPLKEMRSCVLKFRIFLLAELFSFKIAEIESWRISAETCFITGLIVLFCLAKVKLFYHQLTSLGTGLIKLFIT